MWSFLARLVLKRLMKSKIFKYAVLAGFICIAVLSVMLWMVIDDTFVYKVAKDRMDKEFQYKSKDIAGKLGSARTKYNMADNSDPDTGGLSSGANNGARGNGVNLLLINDIKTEGYVKEMLELYRDSGEGKITPAPHHFPLEAIAGIQYNETQTYDGVVLKSYIPYDKTDKRILWGEPWGSIPGLAMKLRTLNENVINSAPVNGGVPFKDTNKLPYDINGINPLASGVVQNSGPPRDINVFQINRQSFFNIGGNESTKPALLNGYNVAAGRKSDVYYLPDNLSYLDTQFSKMIDDYGLAGTDPLILSGAYSMYHNGGVGSWSLAGGFGVPPTSGKVYGVAAGVEEYAKNTTVISKDVIDAANVHAADLVDLYSRSAATLLLLEKGYYLSTTAFNTLTEGYTTNTLKVWKGLYKEDLTKEQLKEKLRPKTKTVTEVYPNYLSAVDFSTVYGYSPAMNDNQYGGIWKLEETTSGMYLNKANGSDPRVLHYTNVITAGHVLDTTFTGRIVYARMLKYAKVGVDPTNPESYMSKIKGEFQPGVSANFNEILSKIGLKDIDPRVKEMFEWGYLRSGFLYFLGGQGLQVSKDNFNAHYRFTKYYGNPLKFYSQPSAYNFEYFTKELYVTKDKSIPDETTPDSNLVNYGKYLFDCSSLTAQAYNETIATKLGLPKITDSSYAQYTSGELVTISNWNDAKAGDIFVTSGHVFFFMGYNKGSESVSLSVEESKFNNPINIRPGYMFVLEASTEGERVGIHVRSVPQKGQYILRRFKALM
jgi:hypothetical protein